MSAVTIEKIDGFLAPSIMNLQAGDGAGLPEVADAFARSFGSDILARVLSLYEDANDDAVRTTLALAFTPDDQCEIVEAATIAQVQTQDAALAQEAYDALMAWEPPGAVDLDEAERIRKESLDSASAGLEASLYGADEEYKLARAAADEIHERARPLARSRDTYDQYREQAETSHAAVKAAGSRHDEELERIQSEYNQAIADAEAAYNEAVENSDKADALANVARAALLFAITGTHDVFAADPERVALLNQILTEDDDDDGEDDEEA